MLIINTADPNDGKSKAKSYRTDALIKNSNNKLL